MSFFSNIQTIAEYIELSGDMIDFEPTYHKVAQSYCRWPVVIGNSIKLFEWGLIADYMNTPEKIKEYRSSMANARSEKILDDKRSVWHRIRKQRCLVATTGFFEHQDTGAKKKLPYFIRMKASPVFFLAGLYNYSPLPDPETGEMTGTFSIVTREGNTLMKELHNSGANSGRMPLILPRTLAKKWLDPSLTDEDMRTLLSYEYPSEDMEYWPVHSIRTRKPDDASVIQPIGEL
jgi:putative SOS response-associated peptidase YedK